MNWPFAYARGSELKFAHLWCGLLISMAILPMSAIIAIWVVFAQTMTELAICVLKLIILRVRHIF